MREHQWYRVSMTVGNNVWHCHRCKCYSTMIGDVRVYWDRTSAGRSMTDGVVAFQALAGVRIDGIIGPETVSALEKCKIPEDCDMAIIQPVHTI